MDWKDYQIKGICFIVSSMLCTRLTTKKGGTKLIEFIFRGGRWPVRSLSVYRGAKV